MTKRPYFKKIVYGLMVTYVIFVVSSVFMLDGIVVDGESYSLEMNQNIMELRSRCNSLEVSLPRLLSHPRTNIAIIDGELERQEKAVADVFARISHTFRGNPNYLASLGKALDSLGEAKRQAAAELAGNLRLDVAENKFRSIVHHDIDNVNTALDSLMTSVQAYSGDVHNVMHARMYLIMISAVVAGCLIIVFTMMYDKAIMRASRELTYRESLFTQLAASIDEVFIVASNAEEFEYVSDNCERELGIAPYDICHNARVFYDFLPGDVASWLKEVLNGEWSGNPEERDFAIPSLDKYLKLRVYCLCVTSLKNERYTIVISDQTGVMRHQQALSGALESAHAASEAKSSFLSHMSHEIRTPMNAIIGMTTIALSRINDRARVQDCLGKISESSRHLLGLINDVLDMSKIESGKLSIVHENFNLHQTVDNICNIVRPQVQNRKENFDILLEDVDEENLVGDAMRLNQVLLNILSNAIKFTPEGGDITMRIKQLEKKNNKVRIRFTITDTGIGMSPEYLERLYRPFEQATASTASKYGGTGLGMPITANLVTMMGGSINVVSKEGVGTTFFIEIPFDLSGEASFEPDSLPPLKILVVDDDEGTCEHTCLLLEQMGLRTAWAMSGKEAVELARKAHNEQAGYDICLVDWKMPGMNGGQTARAIRDVVGDDVLIIIVSAYDWAAIEGEACECGVDDFISKPLFASTLHGAITAANKKLSAEGGANTDTADRHEYDFIGHRVLLVEDNEFNREIGQEFLEMVNVEVEMAENGKEAVEKMTSAPEGYYDLILMDVQMPVMDGYEATKMIRASSHPEAQSIGIVAMTANAFTEDVARAVAAGMNAHLAKPIDVNALYEVLSRYFQKQTVDSAADTA